MTISDEKVDTRFFGIPSLVQRLPYEISIANFTVMAGANALQRPVGGGTVASGALKNGKTVDSNATNNTVTGQYLVTDLWSFGYGQGAQG
jgi:alkaline phosphatase D